MIMGCDPDIAGSHTFDEAVPRVLKHIVQVTATSEFAKPCSVPSAVPYLFHRVSWVEDRHTVGQWDFFSGDGAFGD